MSKAGKTPVEKISITRALTTLKLLDKRINKAVNGCVFVNIKVGDKEKYEKFTPKEDLQSVTDLIAYRARMKSAIMTSNSNTKVKIGKTEMTVVEAIELKDSIQYKKSLLNKLVGDYNRAKTEVENTNIQVSQRLDSLLVASFGKDVQNKGTEYEATSKQFLKHNEANIVDPLGTPDLVQELQDEIDTFEAEVDFVLSESNATTLIEV